MQIFLAIQSNLRLALALLLFFQAANLLESANALDIEAMFSAPDKLPPPINTTDDDRCPVLSSDGLEIYFASDRDGRVGD